MSYPHEFDEDLTLQLSLDDVGFLIDEAEDIWGKHRDEILPIPQQFLIIFPAKLLFIEGQCPLYVLFDQFAIMIYKKRHKDLHFNLKTCELGAIETCPT